MKTILLLIALVCTASGQEIKLRPAATRFYAVMTIDTVPRITVKNDAGRFLTIDCGFLDNLSFISSSFCPRY